MCDSQHYLKLVICHLLFVSLTFYWGPILGKLFKVPTIDSPPHLLFLPSSVLFSVFNKSMVLIFLDQLIVTTPTTTQPQHCSWVGHENDFAHHHHHPPPTTETQHQPLGAPDEHLFTLT